MERQVCRVAIMLFPLEETLPNTSLCRAHLAPAHLSMHSILAPTTYLLALPHSHPSIGCSSKPPHLAQGCSPGQRSTADGLHTPQGEMMNVPCIQSTCFLLHSSYKTKQLPAFYPPKQDTFSLAEAFGHSCQGRANICSEELGPHPASPASKN